MNKAKSIFKGNIKQYSMLIALVAIIVFFQIVTKGSLLKPMNVSNIVFQNAYVVILAVGMLLCILTGRQYRPCSRVSFSIGKRLCRPVYH